MPQALRGDPRAHPKLAVYTHIAALGTPTAPPPNIEAIVAETRETYTGPLEVGEDLTSFDIGDTVTAHRFKP